MRILLALFAVCAIASAQNTAVFPTRAATTSDLPIASNRADTTLTQNVLVGDLTLNVAATTLFPVPSVVTIDSEILNICSKTSNTLVVCASGRGFDGSVAAGHLSAIHVQGRTVARHVNQTAAEVIALETAYRNQVVNAANYAGADMGAKINAACASTPGSMVSLPAGSFSYTTTIVASAGCVIAGAGEQATTLVWTGSSSGKAVNLTLTDNVRLTNLAITTATAGTTTGVYVSGSNVPMLDYVDVSGFATNVRLTWNGTTRTFNAKITNSEFDNHTVCGICIDHAVDTYLSNLRLFAVAGNPTTAWGIVYDTGASGLYMNSISDLFAGMKIQNSMPSGAAFDLPPEHLFASQILTDTVTGTPSILLDASLSVADAASRKGKGYHFVNSWASFTQTAAMSGLQISGGEDITFTDFRARVNRANGIRISGGDNIRIVNPVLAGNNLLNESATGAGLYVDAGVIQWQVIGGRSGNVAGEGPNQKYGIYLAAGATDQFVLNSVDVTNNVTAGISDGSTGPNKTIFAVCDAGVTLTCTDSSITSGSRRLNFGDGNFFFDFNNVSAANPVIGFGAGGAVLLYNRSLTSYSLQTASTERIGVSAAGLSVGTGSSISKTITGNGTFTFGSVTAQTCSEQIFAVGSAATTNAVYVSPNYAVEANLSWSARVSSAGNVAIRLCNPTAGNISTAASSPWRVWVLKE